MSFFAHWESERFAHQLRMETPDGPVEYSGEGPLDASRFAMSGFGSTQSVAELFTRSLYLPASVEERLVAYSGVRRPEPEPTIALDAAPAEIDRAALGKALRQLARAQTIAPSNGSFTDSVTLERAERPHGSWQIVALHTVRYEGTNPAYDGPWEQTWRLVAHLDAALEALHSVERTPA